MTLNNGKKKLNIDEKWKIYQETSAPGAQVGEILRKHGMYPNELAKIRRQVEDGAPVECTCNIPNGVNVARFAALRAQRPASPPPSQAPE